jgi:hypothetical protein
LCYIAQFVNSTLWLYRWTSFYNRKFNMIMTIFKKNGSSKKGVQNHYLSSGANKSISRETIPLKDCSYCNAPACGECYDCRHPEYRKKCRHRSESLVSFSHNICSRVVDPDSMTLWIRIRIGNLDPGSRAKKMKKNKYFFS